MSTINQISNTPEPRKSAEKAKAPAQRKPGLSGQHGLSMATCVRTLSQITLSRKGLLNLEMAVGLAVFLDAGVANKSSKGMLAEIYSKAGYDCAASSGRDYKTVNRRIAASSALFGKLGLEVVNHWASEKGETKLLNALAQRLVEMNFGSLDDVLDYVGRTSNRSAKSSAHAETSSGAGKDAKAGPQEGAAAGVKSVWDIAVGTPEKPVVVHIPHSLGEAELIELASKILTLAETLHEAAQEGAGAVGDKTEGAVQERRLEAVAVELERRAG